MKKQRSRLWATLATVLILALTALCGVAQSPDAPERPEVGGLDALFGADGALPVLEINIDTGELPADVDTAGTLRAYGADGSPEAATDVLIRLRGNTSRRFPKKSYRLKLVDGQGEKRDLSLCGLRADDDWILNPLYSDTSKIREALSQWLWARINSRGQAAAGSGLAYVEVVLNGEYWGLYALQERIDRKQVGADREWGMLYKVIANDRPTARELLDAGNGDVCRGIELAFAGAEVDRPWIPASDYLALLEGEALSGGACLSRENAVDYALWSMLVQARDNHFKNMFIHCAPEGGGYALYRIPWDLNHTLGDQWAGESPETNWVQYEIGDLALDDVARALLDAGDEDFRNALRARWAELRSGSFTEESILGHARALFESLYPAILRDTARWPLCGMGEGSAANIRDIEDHVRVTLEKMDRF